jgi:segregation and condensation protein B
MEPHDLTPLVEALLFAADRPLTPGAIAKIVDDETVTATEVRSVLEILAGTYEIQARGCKLVRFGNAWQMLTREQFAPWVQTLVAGRREVRLSRAALETVAVIAYKQPITRLGIERIRGVDVGGVLNTLLERNLIMIKGRDVGLGRPLLYGTTQAFLDYFGLEKVSDLPRLDEIASLARGDEEAIWDEKERARIEKHGIEPETLVPVEEVTGEDTPDAGEGEGAETGGPTEEAETEPVEAGAAGDSRPEAGEQVSNP